MMVSKKPKSTEFVMLSEAMHLAFPNKLREPSLRSG